MTKHYQNFLACLNDSRKQLVEKTVNTVKAINEVTPEMINVSQTTHEILKDAADELLEKVVAAFMEADYKTEDIDEECAKYREMKEDIIKNLLANG